MDEFETIADDWNDLEESGIDERFAEITEPTSDDLEAEFEKALGY